MASLISACGSFSNGVTTDCVMVNFRKNFIPNVLIIDNDDAFRPKLESALCMRGFAVMCEKHLCNTKLVLAKKFPHVLLMNSTIQNECGIQFVRAMKNSGCVMSATMLWNI
jgi:ActR/RegA family two-component response regulator